MTKALVTLRVNGETHTVAAEPHHTLLEVLRDELGLTGHQAGLRAGRVRRLHGARRRRADARVPHAAAARSATREVTTVEGLANGRRAAPAADRVRRAGRRAVRLLHARDAVSAKALLDAQPRPTRDEIARRDQRQPLPLHRLHVDLRGDREGERERERVLGHRPPPAEGQLRWAHLDRDGALRRRHRCRACCTAGSCAARTPHARIRASTSRARWRIPGVVAVVTGRGHAREDGDHPVDAGRDGARGRQGALRRRPGRGGRRGRRGHGVRGARR